MTWSQGRQDRSRFGVAARMAIHAIGGDMVGADTWPLLLLLDPHHVPCHLNTLHFDEDDNL